MTNAMSPARWAGRSAAAALLALGLWTADEIAARLEEGARKQGWI